MKRRISLLTCFLALFIFMPLFAADEKTNPPIGMAVEFTDHAACAHIAKNKGWYKEVGLNINSFDNYLTGMALAAGLSRGDINVAYMCLIPAINAYANGKVPLKVVAGTHKYGYGLLVDTKKISSVKDLEKDGIRIGCPREGSSIDVLIHKMIDKYNLDGKSILGKTRRMPPSKVFLALKAGQLDAGFCCEQFTTMGEESGFNILLTARDLWPDMQGSVLVVKEDLIKNHPEIVKKLVEITAKGIRYIHEHPDDAAAICAGELSVSGKKVFPLKLGKDTTYLNVTPDIILKSMTSRMHFTTDIDTNQVQQYIDYMAQLGYIKAFKAEDMLDIRFVANE